VYLPAGDEEPGDSTPSVVPRVDCRQRSGGSDTYWFGYRNQRGLPVLVRVAVPTDRGGPANAFAELDRDEVVDSAANRSQVELLLPGDHQRTFAVTVARGHELRWTLTTMALPPVSEGGRSASWQVTVGTDGVPPCPRGTPRRSATVQTFRQDQPTIVVSAGPGRLRDGLLVASSLRFDVAGITSACSEGGTPLPAVVLWGFDDGAVPANEGVGTEVPRDGFVPLPPGLVARTDTFGSGSQYQRTLVGFRRIADPQRPWTSPETGVTSRGVAVTQVLADVYGLCRFGRDLVLSTLPMWVRPEGFPVLVRSLTDPASQSTVTVTCTTEPDCPIPTVAGPGGARWR
jgi:hypothetical protein